MGKINWYRIYGLIVESEIEIPEAFEIEKEDDVIKDVSIKLGEIPSFLGKNKEKGYGTWTNGTSDAWFYTPGAAQYYIDHGEKIIVELEKNANDTLVRSMILSAGMSLILLQRNEVVMHGSALVIDNKTLIICGASGAGKSTIADSLLQNGAGFLADDTVHLHNTNEGVYAEPTYPQQKVCRDMALKNGYDLQLLRYIDEGRDKFAIQRRKEYISHSMPVRSMIILDITESDEVYSEQLSGMDFIHAIIDNLYLEHTYRKIVGIPPEMMKKILEMANYMVVYKVFRPRNVDSVKQVNDEIIKILQIC